MSDRPLLSLREAAEAAGVSRDTIKRRQRAGAFPGSEKGADGAWLIPVEELLAAGFRLHAPGAPGEGEGERQGGAPPPPVSGAEGERERLRAEVEHLRALLAERDRALVLAEMALRALPAGPVRAEVDPGGHRRRRWFRRA